MHCTYLIKTECLDRLNYLDGTNAMEFVVISRMARKNGISSFAMKENLELYTTHLATTFWKMKSKTTRNARRYDLYTNNFKSWVLKLFVYINSNSRIGKVNRYEGKANFEKLFKENHP